MHDYTIPFATLARMPKSKDLPFMRFGSGRPHSAAVGLKSSSKDSGGSGGQRITQTRSLAKAAARSHGPFADVDWDGLSPLRQSHSDSDTSPRTVRFSVPRSFTFAEEKSTRTERRAVEEQKQDIKVAPKPLRPIPRQRSLPSPKSSSP